MFSTIKSYSMFKFRLDISTCPLLGEILIITTSNKDEHKSASIKSLGKEEERHEFMLSMLSQKNLIHKIK